MRGRFACALVAVLGLAACGEEPGAYLTIKASGAKQVSVYIGEDECTDTAGNPCGIAPSGGFDKIHPMDPGGTWFRDSNRSFTAGVSDGEARVRIQPSGRADTVQLIVIAFDDQGVPVLAKVVRDLPVPASDAMAVTLTLDPATMYDGNPHPSGTFADHWGDPSAVTDCVFVQQWDNGVATDTFIVPEEDGDCDGIPTLGPDGHKNPQECDPYWFMAQGTLSSPVCAENVDPVAGVPTCQLGGVACKDGVGLIGAECTHTDPTTCVPSGICGGSCKMPGSTTPLSVCSNITMLPPPQPATYIQCTIYAETAAGVAGGCTSLGSAGMQGGMDLAPLFPGSGRAIYELDFASVDQLYGIESKLKKDTLITPQGDLEIDVVDPLSTQAFTIRWKTGSSALVTGPHFAVADISIDQSPNPNTHMRLPVRIDLADCTNASVGVSCSAVVSPVDTITHCGL